MKIRGNNVGGKAVQKGGDKSNISTNKSTDSKTSATGASGSNDKISLTAEAKVAELTGLVDDLPITDANHVGEIQQQLGTGSYEADDENAAENLLEIEKELSK